MTVTVVHAASQRVLAESLRAAFDVKHHKAKVTFNLMTSILCWRSNFAFCCISAGVDDKKTHWYIY